MRPGARMLIGSSLLLLACAAPASAQPRFSGQVFADAQDALSGFSVPADTSAFRFRRVQFTLDQDLDTTFAVRFQLEADEAELTSRGKTSVFLKQVWLRWSHLAPFGDLYMGLSTTPTWAISENYWGYRSLEKTILDLQGFGFSTDMGVALLRAPSAGHPIGWHLMLANGNGQKPENSASKKLSLSVPVKLGAFVVEGLSELEAETGPRDRWLAKVFGGWQQGANAAGVEAFRRVNRAAGIAGADVVPEGISVFGRHAVGDHWRLIARVDGFDPDTERKQAGYREMFWLAALDATPHANVHVLPNVEVRSFAAKSSTLPERRADVTLRLTLWYSWR